MKRIWYILSMRCEEADRLRSVMSQVKLTRSERIAMTLHQAICRSCRAAARQVRVLDEAVRDLRETPESVGGVPEVGLSSAAKDRIRHRLRAARSDTSSH